MERRFDVLVVGGANFDYLIKARKLPSPGETIAGDTLHEDPGGKGANQAIAAARLSARTAFVGRVGDDPPRRLSYRSLSCRSELGRNRKRDSIAIAVRMSLR